MMTASGIRGIVGESLDPGMALKIGQTFGKFLGKGPVIVGGDTRTSYEIFKQAVVSGLLSVGIDVIDIGQAPTPTCQQMIRHHHASGGIVITASHNPIEWNGIKLMGGNGSFLSQNEFESFMALYTQNTPELRDWKTIGTLSTDPTAIDKHIDKILAVIDPQSIRDAGFKVLVDTNNGTGCLATPKLLDRLGVSYDLLGPEPNGVFTHTPEPSEATLQTLLNTLKSGGYDIGFAQDPDADRLVIADEKGTFIGEDCSLGFCVDYILGICTEPLKRVVVNLSTSNLIQFISEKHSATLHHTKIGETHVTEGIRDLQAVVGGEGNGGVIFPEIGWGRDSLVGITVALKYLAESKKTVSDIVSTYPKYTLIREKVSIQDREDALPFIQKVTELYPDAEQDTQDGIKLIFEDSWLQLRPSNTEPIVRIFAEAPSHEAARTLVSSVLSLSQ